MTVVEPAPKAASIREQVTDALEKTSAITTAASRSRVEVVAAQLIAGPLPKADVYGARPDVREHAKLRLLQRVRAWMVVPAVDFLMLISPLLWRPPQTLTVLTLAILGTLLMTGGARYVAPLHLSVMDDLPGIVTRLLAAVAAVAAVVLHLHAKPQVLVFLETACQAVALVIVGRVLTTRLIAWGRQAGIAQHPTVLIGGGQVAKELATTLMEHREYGLLPVGFLDESGTGAAADVLPRMGQLSELDVALITAGADTILIADGEFDERTLIDAVRSKTALTAELLVVPRLHHFHTLTGTADHIGSIPIMRIRNPNLRGPARIVKRVFDVLAAGASLILLCPILAAAALAVRVEGGPGVIFRQTRVGRDGNQFELLKFRSMRPENDIESQTQWNVSHDNRIGPVGKFLRRTSIDELPQLWNILRGDMTVVGPRPERPHFVEQFSTQYDRYIHRHRVQVGLTGFAQVSGLKGDTSIADRCRYDNFYIENWSLWLDIKIIIRTFRAVVLYREK